MRYNVETLNENIISLLFLDDLKVCYEDYFKVRIHQILQISLLEIYIYIYIKEL